MDESIEFLRRHLEPIVVLLSREYCHTWSWAYPIDYLSSLTKPVDLAVQREADASSKCVLYIHIPFCTQKCDFCQFYRPGDLRVMSSSDYVGCLKKEMRRSLDINARRDVLSVYIGGGTPTLLSPADVEDLLKFIRDNFSLRPDAELTIETEPQYIVPEMAKAIAEGGATEVVFGVQSFNEEKLKGVNRRRQTNQHVHEGVRRLRAAGPVKVAFDMIFGLAEGETSKEFLEDNLGHIVDLRPEVVVVHPLQNYRKLPSTLKELPIHNLDEVYHEIGRHLGRSKPTDYHSQYFYYRFVEARDILAVGLGGTSTFFVDGRLVKKRNIRSKTNDLVGYGQDARDGQFRYHYQGQEPEEALRWYLAFNLHRAYGVDVAVARERFPSARPVFEELISRLRDELVAFTENGRMRLRSDYADRLPFRTNNDQVNYYIFSFCYLYSDEVRRNLVGYLRDKFALTDN